jgi:uncharacterized protein (TIGR02118 family)
VRRRDRWSATRSTEVGPAHGEDVLLLETTPDLSPEEFHRYWREQHGPLFCNSAIARRYCLRYEQNHATPENADIGGDEFDGVSVMWFRSVDEVNAMRADPEFRDVVVADGDKFLDGAATKLMISFAEEPLIVAVENP